MNNLHKRNSLQGKITHSAILLTPNGMDCPFEASCLWSNANSLGQSPISVKRGMPPCPSRARNR
jgi:hypothetical protein